MVILRSWVNVNDKKLMSLKTNSKYFKKSSFRNTMSLVSFTTDLLMENLSSKCILKSCAVLVFIGSKNKFSLL